MRLCAFCLDAVHEYADPGRDWKAVCGPYPFLDQLSDTKDLGFPGGKGMILLVKFLYFSISFLGYGLWAARKWRIRCEFFPILYCASVSNLLFFAGILNLMPMMALIVWSGGCAALIFSLKKKFSFKKENYIFTLYSVWFLFIFPGCSAVRILLPTIISVIGLSWSRICCSQTGCRILKTA